MLPSGRTAPQSVRSHKDSFSRLVGVVGFSLVARPPFSKSRSNYCSYWFTKSTETGMFSDTAKFV